MRCEVCYSLHQFQSMENKRVDEIDLIPNDVMHITNLLVQHGKKSSAKKHNGNLLQRSIATEIAPGNNERYLILKAQFYSEANQRTRHF